MKIKLIVLFGVAIHTLPLFALDSFSYSGRLVNTNGSPVTGEVNLRFDLSSTEDPTDVLCSKTIYDVPLSQGIFNVKLDFQPEDCGNKTILSIMEDMAPNHNLTYQVTDLTNSRTYSHQAIYSVPSSFIANSAKSLSRMGATADGQVLKWNAASSKWIPGTVGSGNGTVTTINTGSGLYGGPIVNSGTISVAPGGITDSHLATGISPEKLSGSRDATKYLRGDNTWSSFQSDLLATLLNGFSPVSGSAVSNSDSIIQAFGKLQGQISTLETNKLDKQGGTLILGTIDGVPQPTLPSQIVNKQYVDDLVGDVNASQWTTAAPHIFYNLGNVGIGTSTPNEKLQVAGNIALNGNLRLKDSGTNYIELKAPLTTSGVTFTLPADAGTSGQALTTDGSGVLSWQNPSVSSVDIADGSITNDDINASANIDQSKIAGLTAALSAKASDFGVGAAGEYLAGGKVWTTLNTDVVPEGTTRLYFTEARVLGTDLAGFTSNAGTVTSGDTVLSAIEKLAGNQTNFVLRAGDTMSGNLVMDGNRVSGLGTPSDPSDAATKEYVDTVAASASPWTKIGSIVHYNLGNVGIGTATPRSKLEVTGGIQIGSDADACSATKVGTLRYNSTNVEYCNGTEWQAFGVSGPVITSLNGSNSGTQSFANGTSGTAPAWSTAAGVHTLNIPLASTAGVTAGLISKTDYDAFSGKLSATATLSGDVSGTYNLTSVDKIKGTSVAITSLTSGNLLRFNGTNWVNVMLGAADIPALDATKITSGTLPIARGGTGATTADGALNNLLPTQTGHSGKVLSTNGTTTSWTSVTTSPAGANGQVQFNNSGAFGASNNFFWDNTNSKLGIGTNSPQALLDVATTGPNSAIIVPRATTANRPSTPVNGMIRYNTSNAKFEGYQNGAWVDLIGSETVTGVTGTAPVVVTGTTAPVVSMTQSNGTNNGYLSSTDWSTFNSKLGPSLSSAKILVGNASNIATPVAASGDVTLANTGAFTVTKLQGRSVSTTAPLVGSFLKWNNSLSNWEPTLFTNCSGANEVLHYTLLTDTWACDTLNINNLLPNQVGNSGKFLTTNGTTTTWASATSSPAGANTQIQFNNSGSFGASAGLIWDNTNESLEITSDKNAITTAYLNNYYSGTAAAAQWRISGDMNSLVLRQNSMSFTSAGHLKADGAVVEGAGNAGLSLTASKISGQIRLYTGGSADANERMTILSNGDIGIGTTTPGAKLEVAGQVKITGGSPGAGKVLTSDATGLATWVTPSGSGDFKSNGTVGMTGNLKLADGTAAYPSLTFGSDIDTGFYKYSSNMVGLSLGGVGRFYYTFDTLFGNAKLGINTTPDRTLHVKQQTVSGVVATFETPAGASLELKRTGSSSMFIQQDAVGNFLIDSVFNETVDPSIFVSLANSNVGIGTTTTTYKLNVGGDINSSTALRVNGTQVCTSAGCTSSSDERLKENIRPLENALEKILQLNGVEYDYIDKVKFGDKHQIGIVAQEVEKVFPEVVVPDEKSGFKSVAYDHLVAPLIEAVKSLARDIASKADMTEIETLKNENETLRKENEEIKTRLKRIEDALQVKS